MIIMKNKNKQEKERTFFGDLIINGALIYSMLVVVFLFPFLYLKNIFPIYVLIIFIVSFVIYLIGWILDKKAFIKNELVNKK